jgi:hypothetical protein
MAIRQRVGRTGGAASVVLVLAGCAASSAPGTSFRSPVPSPSTMARSIAIIDQAGPPPLVLKDSSPARLAASLSLMVGGYDAATRDITEMAIGFSSQGRLVQFVGDERMSCNGTVLPRGGGTFDVKVPTEALAGKTVRCTYTSGQSSATLAFSFPAAPAILSPGEHAVIARSRTTLVRFRVGGQTTMFYITALGPNSKAWAQPGAVPAQVTLDTSRFSPGPGVIALRQSFTLPDLVAPGFESADGRGDAVLQNAVTWI